MLLISSLHPAHRLGCWLLLVVAAQSLSGWTLVASFAIVPLLGHAAWKRWFRLLHRSRWLMLSLLLILAWGAAGEPLWNDVWLPSPTFEGLHDGLIQLGRLSLVLAGIAVLLATTTTPELMSGTHVLLSPLRAVGIDVDPFVVRLALALHYVDELPTGGWRALLVPTSTPGPQNVCLQVRSAAAGDWLVLGFATAIATGVLFA